MARVVETISNTRTYYNVNFDTSKLIKNAIEEVDKHLNVTEIRIVVESGSMEDIRNREELEAGAAITAAKIKTIRVTEAVGGNVTYDLVGELVQITGLTSNYCQYLARDCSGNLPPIQTQS